MVLDNLNTHRMASLYETFPAPEARRIAQRLEFHYTPKHGSWLNMAEIEFSVLSRCCLRQRLPGEDALQQEVQALVTERNAAQAIINPANRSGSRSPPTMASMIAIPVLPVMSLITWWSFTFIWVKAFCMCWI